MRTVAETVRAWPKAELHLHLEGSMRPATVVDLAAGHGASLTQQEVTARYSYRDFDGFIQSYIWVTSFLRHPEDYALIARRLFEELAGQNVIYTEITLSVGVMLWREQDPSQIFAALRAAAEEAAKAGLRVQWVFDVVRQFGPERAMDVARLAVRHREEAWAAMNWPSPRNNSGRFTITSAVTDCIPWFTQVKSAARMKCVSPSNCLAPSALVTASPLCWILRLWPCSPIGAFRWRSVPQATCARVRSASCAAMRAPAFASIPWRGSFAQASP
jgi:hypothetical protein